jgi:hypothetical protein
MVTSAPKISGPRVASVTSSELSCTLVRGPIEILPSPATIAQAKYTLASSARSTSPATSALGATYDFGERLPARVAAAARGRFPSNTRPS